MHDIPYNTESIAHLQTCVSYAVAFLLSQSHSTIWKPSRTSSEFLKRIGQNTAKSRVDQHPSSAPQLEAKIAKKSVVMLVIDPGPSFISYYT